MKKTLSILLISALSITVGHQSANAQLAGKLKSKMSKTKTKSSSGKEKEIGVEIIEDEAGISGTYYTWYPPSVDNSYWKKIPKVAIQYKIDDGKKLTMYASKKEFINYYTGDFVKTYNMTEICGLYTFERGTYNAPNLWTIEPGTFISLDVVETNSTTCEFEKFKDAGHKTFIMSKDKALIDGMTLEKFQEIVKKQKMENCGCYRDYKMNKNPAPARGIVDAEVEKMSTERAIAKAKREHWDEEIMGVYISSKKWDESQIWKTTAGELTAGQGAEVVVVMKNKGACYYQKGSIMKNVWGAGSDGVIDRQLDLKGVYGSILPMSCTKAEELIK